MDQNYNVNNQIQPKNGLATAGLIVSMVSILFPVAGITGIVGFILSAIGLVKSVKLNGKGKVFGILGIIIGAIGIVYGIYYFVTTISALGDSVNEIVNSSINY